MSTPRPNPFKPLIIGVVIMGAVAAVTLACLWIVAEQREREAQFARKAAENQQRFQEQEARYRAENEARRQKIAEADRRAFAEREAAAAKRKAELAARRPIDVRQHVEALRLKAEAGDPESQYLYGWLNRFGTSGLGDFNPDGTATFLRPLTAPPVFGENLTGKLHEVRFVDLPEITRDEAVALKWFARAARQGHAEGQYELAHHHSFDGDGYDLVEAYKWYLIARTRYLDAKGYVHSTRHIGADGKISYEPLPADARPYAPPGLVNQLTAEQKAEAERRAKAFKPTTEHH
jgi:hypothetical protein